MSTGAMIGPTKEVLVQTLYTKWVPYNDGTCTMIEH